ncbi:Neprilysin-2 [Nymphon striatum]|nr:Neprilysin-2 [Nymphon striatum]
MCSANEILSSMNLSADPCHDFYNFVCGKWSQKYPIREVDLASSTFINIKNQVTENIKDILESAEKGEISHRIMKDVLKFYRRCQDEVSLLLSIPYFLTEFSEFIKLFDGEKWKGASDRSIEKYDWWLACGR